MQTSTRQFTLPAGGKSFANSLGKSAPDLICKKLSLASLPDNMYMTPVTIQAVTCFCRRPNMPVRKAVNRHRRLTMVQEAAEFIMPAIKEG